MIKGISYWSVEGGSDGSADIARALVVSPNTVKTQLQSLYRKLEVSDRASAIRAAHAWGLIESDTDL